MILGIGTDIAEVPRFKKWVQNPVLIDRFFNECEHFSGNLERALSAACEHYAVRFAAKEAFSKALGTGFVGLELKDFGIVKNEEGKPDFVFGEKTQNKLDERFGKNLRVHVSLSHEKSYAVAFVVIEK